MEQITKYIGLVAMVTILAVVTVSISIDEVEAISREGIRHDNVVLPEPEPEVDLTLQQITEPRESHEVSIKTTKGFVPKTSDSDAVTYRVVYMIQNDGTTDVKNVMISIHSDTETVEWGLSGKLDPKHSTITILVKSVDPTSIDAKIVGYEI